MLKCTPWHEKSLYDYADVCCRRPIVSVALHSLATVLLCVVFAIPHALCKDVFISQYNCFQFTPCPFTSSHRSLWQHNKHSGWDLFSWGGCDGTLSTVLHIERKTIDLINSEWGVFDGEKAKHCPIAVSDSVISSQWMIENLFRCLGCMHSKQWQPFNEIRRIKYCTLCTVHSLFESMSKQKSPYPFHRKIPSVWLHYYICT